MKTRYQTRKSVKAGEPAHQQPSRTNTMAELREDELPEGDLLQEFTVFPNLPPETRQAIWDIAALDLPPNYITISNVGSYRGERENWALPRHTPFDIAYKAKASYKIPGILHANQESRLSAKKILRTTLDHQFPNNPIYFDFAKDFIVVDEESAILALAGGIPTWSTPLVDPRDLGNGLAANEVFQNVRNLVIKGSSRWFKTFNHSCFFLDDFKQLDSLSVIKSGNGFPQWILDYIMEYGQAWHGDDYSFPTPKEYTKLQMEKLILGIPIDQRVKWVY